MLLSAYILLSAYFLTLRVIGVITRVYGISFLLSIDLGVCLLPIIIGNSQVNSNVTN